MGTELVSLIISLISGAAGGNIAGAAMKDKNNLGAVGNTIAGLVGGGVGGSLLQYLGLVTTAAAEGKLDVGSIIANIGTSGVSGAVVLLIASFIKNSLLKK